MIFRSHGKFIKFCSQENSSSDSSESEDDESSKPKAPVTPQQKQKVQGKILSSNYVKQKNCLQIFVCTSTNIYK